MYRRGVDTVPTVWPTDAFVIPKGEPMSDSAGKTPVELTANIVSAYLSNNPTQASEIPNLISQIHAALIRVSSGRPGRRSSRRSRPCR